MIGAKRCIGLSLGRDHIFAVQVSAKGGSRTVEWAKDEALPEPLFQGAPTPAAGECLREAIAKLRAEFPRAFVPVQVAIPDPAAHLAVFELEQLPASRKRRLHLARWRIANAFALDGQDLACAHQYLGREGGTHLLLGVAMDGGWLRCVKQALRHADVPVSTIDVDASYRFNRFYEHCATGGTGGAMVALQPQSWTLSVWDGQKRLRLLRSRWRQESKAAQPPESIKEIAGQVAHTIRAFTGAGAHHGVARIYVMGSSKESDGLANLLDRRTTEPCLRLADDHEFDWAGERPAAAAGAALSCAVRR